PALCDPRHPSYRLPEDSPRGGDLADRCSGAERMGGVLVLRLARRHRGGTAAIYAIRRVRVGLVGAVDPLGDDAGGSLTGQTRRYRSLSRGTPNHPLHLTPAAFCPLEVYGSPAAGAGERGRSA